MEALPLLKSGVKVRANPVRITDEQVHFYDENGYVVIPGLFNEEDCDKMVRVAETMADPDYAIILNIHRKIDLFLEVMKAPALVAIVKAVQRHKMVGLNTQFVFKRCGTSYARQSWNPHQDNSYFHSQPGDNINLHIFLDPHDPENGGLFYWPGSQKEDLLPFENVVSWREGFDGYGVSHPGQTVDIPAKYQKIDVVGPKGAICLQHGHIIHGSHPNLSPTRSRHQYSVTYIKEGAEFFPGRNSPKIPVPLE